MATKIGELYAKVGADTSEFSRKMKGVDKDLQDTGKKVGGLGKILQVGFGAAIAGGAAAFAGRRPPPASAPSPPGRPE